MEIPIESIELEDGCSSIGLSSDPYERSSPLEVAEEKLGEDQLEREMQLGPLLFENRQTEEQPVQHFAHCVVIDPCFAVVEGHLRRQDAVKKRMVQERPMFLQQQRQSQRRRRQRQQQ